jgi:UDP-N-acetylglucosamine 3-dehydrogenase
MPKTVRVAVVGAGNMGRHHVRNYHELSGCELVGLADMSPAGKELADQYGIPFFHDAESLLATAKPDAVSVVVPTPYHFAVASEVLRRGVSVLVEKPIAATVEEGRQLVALARQHDCLFTVGHIERFNPAVRHLQALVEGGRLGDISAVVVRRVGGFPQREPSTDVIVDLAIHDIDVIASLLRQPARLMAAHGSRTLHSQMADSAELLLDLGGASGFIQTNWVTPVKIRTISITGSKGYVEANYITQEVLLYEHTAVEAKMKFADFVAELGQPKMHVEKVAFWEPLGLELELFVESVRTGKNAGVVDPEDAIAALDLALQASAMVREAQQ